MESPLLSTNPMNELFVKPSFGKNRLVQVKKSDVRKFYNSLADGKVLKDCHDR